MALTEGDLSYFYAQIEALWFGGFGTTLERIRSGIKETPIALLVDGLATLVDREWLKIEQIAIGDRSDELRYELWYVPIRDNR